jgi:hypothetical protein
MYAMCGLQIATHKPLISVWTMPLYMLALLHGSLLYSLDKHPLKQA